MSESESGEGIRIAANGVRVRKTFSPDAFPVPAIAFRITSDRTEPVSIRLVDTVPENVTADELGFHPEYGNEYWSVEDEQITFERRIEPDEAYTTVYGIRAVGTDDIEQFLTEPDITTIEPEPDHPEGEPAAVTGNSQDIDMLDLGTPTGTQTADGEADSGQIDPVDESVETGESADAGESGTAGSPQGSAGDTAVGADTLVATLADEIRAGAVASEDLAALREALDGQSAGRGSTDARIRKLQSDVGKLDAYIDALETFLDDQGTADIIERLEDDLGTIQQRVDDLETTTARNTDRIEPLEDSVEGMADSITTLEDEIAGLDAELGAVEDKIEQLQDLESRLSVLETAVEDLQEWRDQLRTVLGDT